jgi:hypothetical protein
VGKKWPFEEQTWLTVAHRTPGGMVLVETPCGCLYQAARHFGGLLEPWSRLLVLRVMDSGDLLVEDGRRRVHRLSGLGPERRCDRHRREELFWSDE